MNPDELLALGAAMVSAVRESIPFSENQPEVYRDHIRGSFASERIQKRDEINKKHYNWNRKYAQIAMQESVGLCDELSLISTMLASMIAFNSQENLFVTAFQTPTHAFCLLHQSPEIAQSHAKQLIAQDFRTLSENPKLKNAIIIDSWINKATKLLEYPKHVDHAQLFKVQEYYQGRITSLGYTERFNYLPSPPNTVQGHTLLADFKNFHLAEKEKLSKHRGSFGAGNRLSFVQRRLDQTLLERKQLKQLKQLKQELLTVNTTQGKRSLITQLPECMTIEDAKKQIPILCGICVTRQNSGFLHPKNTTTTGNRMVAFLNYHRELRELVSGSHVTRFRDLRSVATHSSRSTSGNSLNQEDKQLVRSFSLSNRPKNQRTPKAIFMDMQEKLKSHKDDLSNRFNY